MACSCKANKTAVTNTTELVTLPHSILPGESCIFCAEKHVSVAFSTLTNHGILPVTRQIMLGELECARRHTFVEYPAAAKAVSKAIMEISSGSNDAQSFDAVDNARSIVSALAEETKDGKDSTGGAAYEPNTSYADSINPLIGELCFSAAWRLAHECGYASPNRSMIIGDLTLAQENLYNFNYNFAERIRELRHKIQRSENRLITKDWIIMAQNLDVLIRPVTTDIKKIYGDSLSSYLTV